MKYLVLFEDNPDCDTDVRQQHMQDHLEFLGRDPGRFDAAGPLLSDETITGGAWVLNADSIEEVENQIRTDPFWPTGLRKSYRILAWRQVYSGSGSG